MLKAVGSLVIVAASIGLAQTLRKELHAHMRLLYELRRLLLDIAYAAFASMQPVEILLGCFIQTRDERLNRLCKEMAERLTEKQEERGEDVWRSTVFQYRKELQLSEEEAEVIESAGSAFFGKSVDENRRYLAVVLERLDFLIETARGEQKERQKVYGTVSVLCGLLLVLLLV